MIIYVADGNMNHLNICYILCLSITEDGKNLGRIPVKNSIIMNRSDFVITINDKLLTNLHCCISFCAETLPLGQFRGRKQ